MGEPLKEIPESVFADDAGQADPRLTAALESGADLLAVVDALAGARVLVPVVAQGEQRHQGRHGWEIDAVASTGVVALRARDGRLALPIFTDVAAMSRWHDTVRPIPAEAPRAALAAAAEQWALMVLNPGSADLVIPRTAVWALAQGLTWEPAVSGEQVDPDVVGAIRTAVPLDEEIRAVTVEPGDSAEVRVVLALKGGLHADQVRALTARVNEQLAASGVVAQRVDSLQLRLRTAGS